MNNDMAGQLGRAFRAQTALLAIAAVAVFCIVASAQDSITTARAAVSKYSIRSLYMPNVQLGDDFQAELIIHNRSPKEVSVLLIPYTGAGAKISELSLVVPAFGTSNSSIADLPSDTRSLEIRAIGGIDATLEVTSLDGQQRESIAAALPAAGAVTFPSGVDRSSFITSTVSMLNTGSRTTDLMIELLDEDGSTIETILGSSLSPMASADLRLLDRFDQAILAEAVAVRVTGTGEIAAVALSAEAGTPLLALTPQESRNDPGTIDVSNGVSALAVTSGSTGVQPIRPVAKNIVLGFNQSVSWATKPHTGVDYVSNLGNTIPSVGPNGVIHAYTETTASGFGSINPDGAGPAIWVKYTLATGQPIYVLYGHTATSWNDKTQLATRTSPFKFNCTYTLTWKTGNAVQSNSVMGKTAPYYNSGKPAQHLHVSVFLPNTSCNNTYCGPPLNGWGYNDIRLPTGSFINPEDFFTLPQYKLKQ